MASVDGNAITVTETSIALQKYLINLDNEPYITSGTTHIITVNAKITKGNGDTILTAAW